MTYRDPEAELSAQIELVAKGPGNYIERPPTGETLMERAAGAVPGVFANPLKGAAQGVTGWLERAAPVAGIYALLGLLFVVGIAGLIVSSSGGAVVRRAVLKK